MFRTLVMLIALGLAYSGNGLFSQSPRTGAQAPAQPQAKSRPAPRKRALLVGVSDYCRDNTARECRENGKYWWDLNSGNDVDSIKAVLMSERFGFKEDEIKVLKTKDETTHSSIVGAFKSFLIGQTGSGDIVYFHYSGHGGQVEDDADPKHGRNPKVGDELDGKDETFIPSDYATQGDGSKDIRDDEIEELLAGLVGRHVAVTADSCHSGTITRNGRRLTRGAAMRRAVAANGRGQADGPSGLFPENASLPASLVVISAARNDQVASETTDKDTHKDMGMFSYALVRALADSGSETTYRDIFERIDGEVTRQYRDQDPQLEGSRDNVLFSGVIRPPQPYINLAVDGSKVMLKAGSLQDMTAGSRFSIYPAGKDSKTGSPVAQAEITAVGPTASVLKLTPEPDEKGLEKLSAARAVETFHNFGDVRLKVSVENAAKAALGEERLRELEGLALLNVSGVADWNVQVCRGRCENEKPPLDSEGPQVAGGLTLMREDGSIIERVPDGPKMLDEVKDALEGEARWRFVKGLKNESDPNLRIKMRLVPVTDVVQDPDTKLAKSARDLAAEVPLGEGGQMALHDGDTVMLEVMNLGTAEPYVSVLDLRSNGGIAPLFPHPLVHTGVNENWIQVKNDPEGRPQWQRIPFPFVIRIGKPYGREVFKAIVTRDEADFSPLFRLSDAEEIQRGRLRGTTRGKREAETPLGQILLTATTGLTRGQARGLPRGPRDGETGLLGAEDAAKLGAPAEDWSTAELTFEALPPRKTTSQAGQPPQSDGDLHRLELNRPVERELSGGQSHSYRLDLSAGQYLHVVVEQRGIDVAVTLFGPDGKQLAEVDSPNGAQGTESISAIAETQGIYRLEVRSLEKGAPAGRYQVKIEELRPAMGQDKIRITAERAFMEADLLRAQATAESLQNAVKKYEEAQALYHSVDDRRAEATALSNIGLSYYLLSEYRKALDYFVRSLPLFRAIGDRSDEADTLNNIGAVYNSLGDRKKAIEYYSEALPVQRAIGQQGGRGRTLANIGVVYSALGEKQKALEYYEQAVTLLQAAGDRGGEATALNNVASVHNLLGERQKALEYNRQALMLFQAVEDRDGEARTLNEIGLVYHLLGERQKALDYYMQALRLSHAIGNRADESDVLNNIGGIYDDLRENQRAIDYYQQGLTISHEIGDSNGEAVALNNIGGVYDNLGEEQKALDYYRQALPLYGDGEQSDQAMTLNNIGLSYYNLGEAREALNYYGQALTLYRAVGDRGREARALLNAGRAYFSLGETQKALDHYGQALQIFNTAGDRDGKARVLLTLMQAHESLNNHCLAIFYGKQSVDVYQQLRSDINGLDKNVQKTYLRAVEQTYRSLAELLIAQGRLAEAQQVLNAFKDQQFFDFDQTQTRPLEALSRTPREDEYNLRYRKASDSLDAIGREVAELKHKIAGQPPADEEVMRLRQLETQLATASREFSNMLRQAETEFSSPAGEKDKVGKVSDTTQMQAMLRQLRNDTKQTAVAVYTLLGRTKFHALIVTADHITAVSSAVNGEDLDKKARELWGVLQSDTYDPGPLSKDLYNAVFKPINDKLPHDTKTILWSLDGNLRYVPMAALYDGKHYLVERYNHVYFTRADGERMTRAVTQNWTATGLGTSAGHTVELLGNEIMFGELPGVGEEMRLLVRERDNPQGIFEGKTLQDAQFTKAAMFSALRRKRPLVHIASHFSFRPGDEDRSFLLLGDGTAFEPAGRRRGRREHAPAL